MKMKIMTILAENNLREYSTHRLERYLTAETAKLPKSIPIGKSFIVGKNEKLLIEFRPNEKITFLQECFNSFYAFA